MTTKRFDTEQVIGFNDTTESVTIVPATGASYTVSYKEGDEFIEDEKGVQTVPSRVFVQSMVVKVAPTNGFVTLSGAGNFSVKKPSILPPIPTNTFDFTFVYGQSLSVGDGGIPNNKNTELLADLPEQVKLYQGVDTNGPGGSGYQYTAGDISTLKPYAEYDVDQSHGWGYYNYLKSKSKIDENSVKLYASVGVGARTAAALSTAPEYTNVPTVIDGIKDANSGDLDYGNVSIHYIQGEADTTPQTDPEVWKSQVTNLLSTDVKTLLDSNTGGSKVDVYIPQLGKGNTHPSGGYAIANAQFELVRDTNNYHMPVAGWICNYLYGRDDYQPHLTSDGYTLMGEYIARAETMVKDGATKVLPPHPISFNVLADKKTVEIQFSNPYGNPLVLDQTGNIVQAAPGDGFGVGARDNVFDILPCTGVSLTGNTLTVTSPEIIEVGKELSAGRIDIKWPTNINFRLPLINLRDEDSELSPSLGIPMHNWASQFIKTFEDGEANVFNDQTQNIWEEAVDPAFEFPKRVTGETSQSTAFGLVAYDRVYPNSTYEVTLDITIVSGTFRLSVGSSTDGLRESFTESGTYVRTVSVTSANGLKADANGTNHDMTLNSISVIKIA